MQGKDFSERVTPLFETMLIQHPARVDEDETDHEETEDTVDRAATTAASLDAEQDNDDAKIQGRYGHDIEINTASTSITTTGINLTTAEPVTTVSTPVTTAGVFVSTAEPSTSPTRKTTLIEDEDLTIAQNLMKIRSKGKMVEPEKPTKKKDQIEFDREVAQRLEAQREEKKTTNQSSKKNQMCTYLKNMAGFTHNQLKNKSFKEVQKAFDKTMSWTNLFVPMDKEVVEGGGKKAKSSRREARREEEKDLMKKVQDVLDLYMLVKERFETTCPEGYDRLLWGDLMTLFEPKKEYPHIQEMLLRMLSRRLKVDHECEMAYELIRIKRLLSTDEITAASSEVTTGGYGFYYW
nr:hypothetical protein [Tanacetum cinerariifolium]